MPKAILALRSYPLAILMAVVLFLCTLILATNSTGIIGGGEDGGSGMGGTGRTGLPGDSGFGGTGGPRPFVGDTETEESPEQQDTADWPAPWLPRETETARIPAEIAPLIELQRNPLRDPTLEQPSLFPDSPDGLRIIEQDTSLLPTHMRQQLDLANSGETVREAMPVEIRLQIPEITAPDPVDISVLQRQLESQQAQLSTPASTPRAPTPRIEEPADILELTTPELTQELAGEAETPVQTQGNNSLADNNNEEIPEILTETQQSVDPRTNAERIQRPELPPFQRLRPAVDRASVVPARPQPMRI